MRQPTLHQLLGGARDVEESGTPLEVYDLFAGAGGFSCGAAAAGCRVVFACDAEAQALETHRVNHPTCTHLCAKLPMAGLPFPTDGRPFHIHCSPPCQSYSTVNWRRAPNAPVSDDLVTWSVQTALSSGATSWTLEQVPSRRVLALLEALRCAHRGRLEYAVFNFAELGVPQTRRRVIAGSPHLVRRLLQRRQSRPPCAVRDAVAPRGTHVQNTRTTVRARARHARGAGQSHFVYEKAGPGDNCIPVTKPGPTILTRRLAWVTIEPSRPPHSRRGFVPAECAALQTFPKTYVWPKSRERARREIGNAVPPIVAELLLSAE